MSKINIRKRGNFYEYRIEIAKVDNKRQWLSKSGFRTKAEALESGSLAYTEYLNAGIPFKQCDLSYSDYLDYWLENYCMNKDYESAFLSLNVRLRSSPILFHLLQMIF